MVPHCGSSTPPGHYINLYALADTYLPPQYNKNPLYSIVVVINGKPFTKKMRLPVICWIAIIYRQLWVQRFGMTRYAVLNVFQDCHGCNYVL